jgi:heme-degrading monooxygenase HmoA
MALENPIFHKDLVEILKVTVVYQWESIVKAQKWAGSPELKAAMEKAGVDGPPVISFLNEV